MRKKRIKRYLIAVVVILPRRALAVFSFFILIFTFATIFCCIFRRIIVVIDVFLRLPRHRSWLRLFLLTCLKKFFVIDVLFRFLTLVGLFLSIRKTGLQLLEHFGVADGFGERGFDFQRVSRIG